jgi:putative hemolysin
MLKELHSIYPVYQENYDDIVGVVNLKNIFAHFDK